MKTLYKIFENINGHWIFHSEHSMDTILKVYQNLASSGKEFKIERYAVRLNPNYEFVSPIRK